MNPPYEMAFNAKINRAEAYSSGSGDVREIKKQLLKMLRDDKNIDYLVNKKLGLLDKIKTKEPIMDWHGKYNSNQTEHLKKSKNKPDSINTNYLNNNCEELKDWL